MNMPLKESERAVKCGAEINGKEAWKADRSKGEEGNKGDEEIGEKIKAKSRKGIVG